jgi:hypothetical protein
MQHRYQPGHLCCQRSVVNRSGLSLRNNRDTPPSPHPPPPATHTVTTCAHGERRAFRGWGRRGHGKAQAPSMSLNTSMQDISRYAPSNARSGALSTGNPSMRGCESAKNRVHGERPRHRSQLNSDNPLRHDRTWQVQLGTRDCQKKTKFQGAAQCALESGFHNVQAALWEAM